MSWLRRLLGRRPEAGARAPAPPTPPAPEEEPEPLEAVELPIEDSIDLHPFHPREVRDVVVAYLDAAWEHGFDEVRLIHGRGIGQQRQAVRKVLERHPLVESFADAGPERGGWGATVARFVRREAEERPQRG